MLEVIIVVVVVLIMVYFVVYPERAPAMFRRVVNRDKVAKEEVETDDEDDGACKPSSKLVSRRNALVRELNGK